MIGSEKIRHITTGKKMVVVVAEHVHVLQLAFHLAKSINNNNCGYHYCKGTRTCPLSSVNDLNYFTCIILDGCTFNRVHGLSLSTTKFVTSLTIVFISDDSTQVHLIDFRFTRSIRKRYTHT